MAPGCERAGESSGLECGCPVLVICERLCPRSDDISIVGALSSQKAGHHIDSFLRVGIRGFNMLMKDKHEILLLNFSWHSWGIFLPVLQFCSWFLVSIFLELLGFFFIVLYKTCFLSFCRLIVYHSVYQFCLIWQYKLSYLFRVDYTSCIGSVREWLSCMKGQSCLYGFPVV